MIVPGGKPVLTCICIAANRMDLNMNLVQFGQFGFLHKKYYDPLGSSVFTVFTVCKRII